MLVALLLTQGARLARHRDAPPKFKGKAPVSNEVLKIKLPRAQEADLSNGAHLMVLEDHRVPSVQFEIIIIGAGGYYDPHDLPGLADTTASLMDEGTTTKTSEQIAQALDTMAASVSVTANQGSQIATVTGSALTDQLDPCSRWLPTSSQPELSDKELGLYKGRARAALEEQRSDPDFLKEERYAKALYGTHPASSVGLTRESLEKITREALVAFHKNNYVPDHTIIGVSGDITLAEARTKFEAALKGWSKSGNRAPESSILPTLGPQGLPCQQAGLGATGYQLGETRDQSAESRLRRDAGDDQILGGANGRLFGAARIKGLHLRRLQHPCVRSGIAAIGAHQWCANRGEEPRFGTS